jgi:hypothetical protein
MKKTKNFEIGVAHRARPHLLADLAELLLFVGYDAISDLSHASLRVYLKEMPASAEDADDNHPAANDPAEKEGTERELEDCWTQLEYREGAFKAFYPFKVDGDRLLWKKKQDPKHQIYLFLLACSRLRSFSKSMRQSAAKAFVEIAREAMRSLAGPSFDVRIFDANSDDRKTYYGTDLRVALRKLGEDFAAHAIHDEHINKKDPAGDAGLDLVAIRRFSDSASGHYTILGQAACRETEWPAKRFEASPQSMRAFFNLLNNPEYIIFIPMCYRRANGEWVDSSSGSGCLVVDRLRLIALLEERMTKANAVFNAKCKALIPQLRVA